MAKSYTVMEAIAILKDGKNTEEVTGLLKHAPLFSYKVIKLLAKAPEEFEEFAACLPEYVTTTKINNALRKSNAGEAEHAETAEDVEEKPAKPAKEVAAGTDYESMSTTEIKELIDARGLRDLCREKFGNARKPNAIKLLKAIDAGEIVVGAEAADDADEEVEEEAGKYDGIPAMKLFKMCKERGLKAKPKQPAKYYVNLLEDADAEEATAAADDDGDDWDDDEAEAAEPQAPAAEANDDDDDWDI